MKPSEAFLDTLYAAPTSPTLWADVLDSCMSLVGAESGWICELDRRDRSAGSGSVRNMEASAQESYFAHFAKLDPFRPDVGSAHDPGLGLWSDERFIAKRDLVRSEFYNDFMVPIRVHSILIVRMYDDSYITRSMHLNYDKRSNRRRPSGWRDLQVTFGHLRRAAALSREFGRLSVANTALRASGGWVVLLDRRGLICFATAAAEAMLRSGHSLVAQNRRLRALRSEDAAELGKLIALATGSAGCHRSGGSMHITLADCAMPAIVSVAPLGVIPPGYEQPAAIVTLRDIDTTIPASDRVLTMRFGMTRAERRIAMMLAAGSSPHQIAETLSISYNTVRNHLKKIYDKLGVHRQGELVSVLLSLGLSSK